MSQKELSQIDIEVLEVIVSAAGGDSSKGVWLVVPHICDHCHDESKEAFPYCVREWTDLCNECFDELECSYGDGGE